MKEKEYFLAISEDKHLHIWSIVTYHYISIFTHNSKRRGKMIQMNKDTIITANSTPIYY